MSDPIREMARAICCRGRNCQTKDGRCVMDPVHYALATAAYNALRETLVPVGWECFRDPSYYDMWCVRPVGSRAFGEGFHLVNGDEAKALAELLGTLFALPEIEP